MVAGIILFTGILAFAISQMLEPAPASYAAPTVHAEQTIPVARAERVLPQIVVVAKRMTDAEKASFDSTAPAGQR